MRLPSADKREEKQMRLTRLVPITCADVASGFPSAEFLMTVLPIFSVKDWLYFSNKYLWGETLVLVALQGLYKVVLEVHQ